MITWSRIQWKPFWLATQLYPQNDWAGQQFRVNYDVCAQASFSLCPKIEPGTWEVGIWNERWQENGCVLHIQMIKNSIYSYGQMELIKDVVMSINAINRPYFSRPREIRVLSREDWLAHNWLVLLLEKCETKASFLCAVSATMQAQVVRGRPVQNGLIDFFPPAIVNSQIAQVDRPKILEQMVFGSSAPLWSLCYFFSLSNWGLRKILSLSEVK